MSIDSLEKVGGQMRNGWGDTGAAQFEDVLGISQRIRGFLPVISVLALAMLVFKLALAWLTLIS
jgi:hypothetical protein